MHRSISVCAALFTLGACGGGGGKASADELGRAVVDALGKKDKAAVEAMVPTIDLLMDTCPAFAKERGEIEKKRAETISNLGESLAKCGNTDWSKAKVTGVRGGELKKPEDDCPELVEAKDVVVVVDLDGKELTIKLDDPMVLKGKFYLFDGVECGGGVHPGVTLIKTAADRICACKDTACATAVTEELMREAGKYSKDQPGPEDMKVVEAESKRMGDCMTKLSSP